MREAPSTGRLPSVVNCPGRCHGGGFDLGRELYDNVVKRRLAEHDGRVKCRGYQGLGRFPPQACGYTLDYRARAWSTARAGARVTARVNRPPAINDPEG